jgi:membrane peptidoglycan carboxypeptidase
MATLLADVINAGTGARVRALGFTLPAAGKTGTTNDFHDAWFVGFTPGLAAGVWLGFDQPRTILPNGYAGDVAVPVWADFMKAATRGEKPRWLQPPPEVSTATVCRLTGLLASDGCDEVEVVAEDGRHERRSMVYTEYFARDTRPTAVCGLHPRPGFFGTIASAFTGGHTQPLPPPRIQDAAIPPAAEPVATAPAESVETVEPPRKKRGFWSRLFGVGKDEETKPEASTPRQRP